MLANSGVRIGELRGLTWDDIESRRDGQGVLMYVRGKTKKRRQVVPQPSVAKYLKRIKDYRESELGQPVVPNEFVCEICRYVDSAYFRKVFNKKTRKQEVKFERTMVNSLSVPKNDSYYEKTELFNPITGEPEIHKGLPNSRHSIYRIKDKISKT